MPRRAHLTTGARPASGSVLATTALVAFLAASLTAGCGRQVAVTPLDDPAPARCTDLLDALPETVLGAGLRPTDAAGTAAWGEPPIVLRCGVARPAALAPTSALIDVNGTGWLAEELTAGTLFTAVDWPDSRTPVYVEIAVPEAYSPAGDVLADVSGAFTRTR